MDYNMERKNRKVRKQKARKVRELMASKEENYSCCHVSLRSPKSNSKTVEKKIPLPNLETYPTFGIISCELFDEFSKQYPIIAEELEYLKWIKHSSTFGGYKMLSVNLSFTPAQGHFISVGLEVPKNEEEQILAFINTLS